MDVAAFERDGFIVVPDVLTADEVAEARTGLHDSIEKNTGHAVQDYVSDPGLLHGGRGNNPAADILSPRWKMRIHMHPRVVQTYTELFVQTFGAVRGIYSSAIPFLPTSTPPAIPLIDRVACRFPGEEGLGLHVDKPSDTPDRTRLYWRPIQSLVCLTDHWSANDGGLQVVRGAHATLDDYLGAEQPPSDGAIKLTGKRHERLRSQLETVMAPAGSMILWDARLPHATTPSLKEGVTREVVYTGFLPNVGVNRRYSAEVQMQRLMDAEDRDWEMAELVTGFAR